MSSTQPIISMHTPVRGRVTVTVRLNLRKGSPSSAAPVSRKAEVGEVLVVKGVVRGENIKGNADWYVGDNDLYFWSGGTGAFQADHDDPAKPIQVRRRPNGTIKVLDDSQIRAVFGDFEYTEARGGRIRIREDWIKNNIEEITVPMLKDIGLKTIQIHRKARGPLERVFERIEAAGLEDLLLTCDGTFVPRHKGWSASRGLSSHSWGIAIDLNVAWNPYGALPAAAGTHGSLRELVPFFEAEGFAWGGYFEPLSICDGMHFELARMDL
jgi:hypothetical protein